MVKKRIIFTLLYDSGFFVLSRNFRLQKVGAIEWIEKNYNLPKVATAIDELVVLDVSREGRDIDKFCAVIRRLVGLCFIPVSVGGGIDNLGKVDKLLESGADKIVLNSAYIENSKLIEDIVEYYGLQFLLASVDVKKTECGYLPYIENGCKAIDMDIMSYIDLIVDLGAGEIYLNSMDQDGTGQGLDLELIESVSKNLISTSTPLIVAGGCGNAKHLQQGFEITGVDAVATANIFNFVGNSLPQSRKKLISANVPLAIW